jgi:hypothetical protein
MRPQKTAGCGLPLRLIPQTEGDLGGQKGIAYLRLGNSAEGRAVRSIFDEIAGELLRRVSTSSK